MAFIEAGVEAYKKDAKDVEVHLLDAGHFALELHAREVADHVLEDDVIEDSPKVGKRARANDGPSPIHV